MNEALSATFQVILVLLPIVAAVVVWKNKEPKKRRWLLSLLATSLFGYLILLFNSTLVDDSLREKILEFDLDQNGTFSEEEKTPEFKEMAERLTSDTARRLAPITGIILYPIYSAFCHFPLFVITILKRRKNRENQAAHTTPASAPR
ncbi:hypothetical protein [Pelagicoccus sp. SDUM812003]|uniref:hypothetical protein n=1 Tax=Pelagicoccus sp. SDUM812003 TaxID=3041267 RepID=UPI00280E03C9|nr:hypothetical protein [Pelagicoccus sp. SDUM812003]MDQ8205793.1 hypothetical protein [Pelagicoccus sp. SDUM812003]